MENQYERVYGSSCYHTVNYTRFFIEQFSTDLPTSYIWIPSPTLLLLEILLIYAAARDMLSHKDFHVLIKS